METQKRLYCYCNRCYGWFRPKKYRIRTNKQGKQTPIFNCTRCNSTTTKYIKDFSKDFGKSLCKRVFVMCPFCLKIMKTRYHNPIGRNHKIYCGKCKKKPTYQMALNKFHAYFRRNPEQCFERILDEFPIPKINKNKTNELIKHLQWVNKLF